MSEKIHFKKKELTIIFGVTTVFFVVMVALVFASINNFNIGSLDDVRSRVERERQQLQELQAEDEKPSKCQRILFYPEQDNLVRNVQDFVDIQLGDTFSSIKNVFPEKGVGRIKGDYIYELKINDASNPQVIKIRLHFSDGLRFIDEVYGDAQVFKIEYVTDTC